MDVVVVGSCMMDLVSYTQRHPKPGETIRGSKFLMGYGGKGANQCVMAARLGAKTAMVAKVGQDLYGNNTVSNFKNNNVTVDHIHQTDEASTGVAAITVSQGGENSIVIVAGANLLLSEQDVEQAREVIAKAKVLVCQLEVPPATSLTALQLAGQHEVVTIFNPAPAVKDLDPAFYSACNIFCANETEAELLTGEAVTDVPSARKAADLLRHRGCDIVIITLGEKGSVVSCDQHQGLHVPVKPVTAVDTTGAGDAFIGALAFYKAVLPSLPLVTCIERASQLAAISCCQPGTQTSFPTADQLDPCLLQP